MILGHTFGMIFGNLSNTYFKTLQQQQQRIKDELIYKEMMRKRTMNSQPDLKFGNFSIYKEEYNCILAHNCSPSLYDKNGSPVYYMCQKFKNDWICWKCRTIAPEDVALIANLCFCREN